MGRHFIAVAPQGLKDNPQIKQLLGKLKRTMKERDQEVRWTPPDLWHITLQFLGELSEDRSAKAREVFEQWQPNVANLELSIHGVGAFPSNDEARVLWLGVHENQAFLDMQADLGERLNAAGFPPDQKEFKPHLTLARFRNTLHAGDLVSLGGRKHFGDYPVGEVILFESVLQGNIIKYVPQLRRTL